MAEKILKTNYPIDLHCHTTRSDGADTPKELIDRAASLGMEIIAITDHDVRPPKTLVADDREWEVRDYAAEQGITLLKGIEVSCETTVEDCHIVCFGCDWTDPFFDKLKRDVVRSKAEGYRELLDRLNARGMALSWEEVLENGGNPVLEEQVQKKMIFELMTRKGYTKDWSEAKLLIKNTPEYQVERVKPDPQEVIREVHRCKGIAIMAHPYLVNEPVHWNGQMISREAYIEHLIAAGLDGIEARYTYAKTSYGGMLSPSEIEAEVKQKYASRLDIISGGSDYHADARKGAKKIRELGECGLTREEYYGNPILSNLIK